MSNAKIHIDIAQGRLDVEGDADLVREIYADFKDQLSKTPQIAKKDDPSQEAGVKQAKKSSSKKKPKAGSEGGGIDPDHPKLDKDLNLSALPKFYSQYEPKNNAEKILLFAHFLINESGIDAPNTDQFYTCYLHLKEKVPKVFSQTFRDAGGKNYGFIYYNSPTDISISHIGINHLNSGIKMVGTE